MHLSRILYVSRCAIGGDVTARTEAIRALACRSAERNIEAQLTGGLLHVSDSFIQVLEGPIKAVERTFEAICRDFRHRDVKVIDLVPVKARMFPEWKMAYLDADTETVLRVRDDLEEIRFLVGVNAREALNLMRRVVEEQPG